MKKNNTILLIGILAYTNLIFAQENQFNEKAVDSFKHKIGLLIGYNQGYLTDLNFSPLNYRENGLLYSLKYTRQTNKAVFNVTADFSLSKIKTKASADFTSSMTMGNLEMSYCRLLSRKQSKTSFYLGGQYNSYLQILDWKEFESFSFFVSHGVGLKGLLQHEFNSKHRITTSLFIPIFQNLVRPPYNGIDENVIENQDNQVKLIFSGKPSSFDSYFACYWHLNYFYLISKRFELEVSYLARYQNTFEINELKHWQNQFSVGGNLKF